MLNRRTAAAKVAEAVPARRPGWRRALGGALRIRELTLIALIAVTLMTMTRLNPFFLTAGNLRSVLVGLAPGILIAIAMAMLLASGGFDLSVSGVMALCGTIAAWLAVHDVPSAAAIGLSLLLGATIGAGNGLLVAALRINPLIATLGTLSVTRGLALVITEGYNISGLPGSFTVVGQQGPVGTPWMVWIAVVLVVLGDVALRRSRLLRQLYYIGGNERSARLSGIRVNTLRAFTYVLSGVLSALAGALLAARLDTAIPTAGQGLELTVIAAAVIGGASLAGGQGSVLGAVLGITFLGLVSNALTLLSVSIFWQIVVAGLILVAAATTDRLVRHDQL
jgi:ribose transport system permease protein